MTRDKLNEHKENMDKIMDRLGGRRDDIWQDRFIYDIAAAIHDLLIEKEKEREKNDSTCYMPTTNTAIICPKCGSSDYIRSFAKDWGITNSEFEYKCINCNTYFGRRSLNA